MAIAPLSHHPAFTVQRPSALRSASVWARAAAALGLTLAALGAHAADSEFTLLIKDRRFEPVELKVPAQTRVKLTVHNQDGAAEEFESHSLNREKLIPAGGKAVIYIGPLKPGRYEFLGEFNPKTARGVVIAE